MSAPLLEVQTLAVELPVRRELRPVLADVSIAVDAGEMVGLVGESGSGKSMTARAIAGLLPAGARTTGEIRFDGRSLTTLSRDAVRQLRVSDIAMVFQDPRAHINPVRRIGDYLCESMRINLHIDRRDATELACDLLRRVGLPDPKRRLSQYPHELSGGMLQRVMIAAALAVKPRLLLADEPTTALDVTVQAEILAILDQMRRQDGLGILFITHDLDLAAAVCDRICVMYAGRVVEEQPASRLYTRPRHPYTQGLMQSRPQLDGPSGDLHAIPGVPISAYEAPSGCPFRPRCAYAQEICERWQPQISQGHDRVACVRADEIDPPASAPVRGLTGG